MKKVIIESEAYAPVGDVYDFFMDFENYGKYSEYVKDVRVVKDGDHPEWEIEFSWWIVRYTSRSRVVDYEEDEFIEWKVTKDVDVHGIWRFEEVDDELTKVLLELWYEPKAARKVNPLSYMPASRLVSLVKPVLSRHVDRVLRRIAAEIEGEPRDVNYRILRAGETHDIDSTELATKGDY